jgi:possible choline sulfatase
MTDDFTVFWRNDEHASALFYDLMARAEKEAYDDDFLAQLAAYREAAPTSEKSDIFAAQYLMHHGDTETAILCGERAYAKRPIHHAVWSLLSRAYKAVGRYTDALVLEGYLFKLFELPIAIDTYPTEAITQEALDRLSVAVSRPPFAPMATRVSYAPEQGLTMDGGVFAGEFLPASPHITPPYYVGVYAEQGLQGDKAWQLNTVRDALGVAYFGAGDFTFDLLRSQRAPGAAQINIDAGQEVVLPVIGTVLPAHGLRSPQWIRVQTSTLNEMGWLNVATPNFFRLDEPTSFTSEHDFIVGNPISVRHNPSRRRLVLNILADAMPWQILRSSFAEWMPQTARFFAQGLIFDQHFSVAEYTTPSFATIETGMYPHHSQLFNNKVSTPLREDYITLSERMRGLGYATANLIGSGEGIYTGASRGYDRILVSSYRQQNYEAVTRAIRQLEGLGDADHFILLHSSDVHPWPSPMFQYPTTAQAYLPLHKRMTETIETPPSPYLRPCALNQEAFWMGVREVDRTLGMLFDYLEQNYAPDEYIVNLYSDHGVSIFSEHPYIVDSLLTGATWMMRGAGIPAGVVTDELTSAVDLYPALGALCGFPVDSYIDGVLPRALGGTGRDITFSNSLFPTKPYFLAARSATHTFCLETEEPVAMDGTIDLAKASYAIYPRDHEKEAGYEVDSPALRAFFYPRVREFLKEISNNGEMFPLPKEI